MRHYIITLINALEGCVLRKFRNCLKVGECDQDSFNNLSNKHWNAHLWKEIRNDCSIGVTYRKAIPTHIAHREYLIGNSDRGKQLAWVIYKICHKMLMRKRLNTNVGPYGKDKSGICAGLN